MEAQLHGPSHGHHHHEDEEHHHHGGKKSVLKKVKEKARKLKDTIKKHGHSHRDDSDEGEDHEVHGAPIHESTVVRSMNLPMGTNSDLDMGDGDQHKQKIEEDPNSPNNSPAKIPPSDNDTKDESHETKSSSKPLSHKVAETLAPVYEKVAGAGDINLKEYMSEKFRPGDEDKKLSEVITDAFHKTKEAVYGAEPEEVGVEEQQGGKGKVFVSKEVAERLGTVQESKREDEDAVNSGQESRGEGVAERLKDAVGSWLGKSAGIQTAQNSVGNAFVNNAASGSGGSKS